jgi:hypothetical protein
MSLILSDTEHLLRVTVLLLCLLLLIQVDQKKNLKKLKRISYQGPDASHAAPTFLPIHPLV